MSLTAEQLLTVVEAIADKCAAATTLIDYIIPTPMMFSDSADVFANLDAKTTQDDIELTTLYALWIDYLRFEDADREHHSPVETLYFDLTLFHESTSERIDEADDFEKQVLKTKQDHVADILGLKTEFQGLNPIVLGAGFTVSETISLVQIDNTQRDVNCRYIRSDKVIGSQTRLECAVRIQTVAC